MNTYHTSVLLQEAIENLQVQSRKQYIDATLGGGGHTEEILKRGGIVLGIDVDQEAIDYVASSSKNKLILTRGNFRDLQRIAEEKGFTGVAGILFDLGVSSHQFDTSERGFSFQQDAVLDMRMDTSLSVTAGDLINALTKEELAELFEKYGEEQFAKRIASAIVEKRKIKRIETTKELAEIIVRAYPKHFPSREGTKGRVHPATKVFQALRIVINDELHSLEESLQQSEALLASRGRIVVISFHSLEDRIVKNTFTDFENHDLGKVITKKIITPTYEDIEKNNRSRSAKMRVFEKR